MAPRFSARLAFLRVFLGLDAAILLALGGAFMAFPDKVGAYAGFPSLPEPAAYLFAMWGCALLSLGVGYGLAVADPVRNVSWVQAGIVRGAMECGLALVMLRAGLVSWHHAELGTIAAAIITVSYIALYPWGER